MLQILLVDDDPIILRGLQRMLARWGHHVVGCTSFDAARDEIRQLDHHIDVVVTDQNLGDGKGTDLADEVARARPTTRTIILTGDDVASLAEFPVCAIEKPVRTSMLLRVIRDSALK